MNNKKITLISDRNFFSSFQQLDFNYASIMQSLQNKKKIKEEEKKREKF